MSDQLGRLFYLFGLHYQSEDCSLHQADHRARFFGRRWLRDAAALPLVKEEGALKAIIYPLHIHRTFESRWATRVAAAKPRRSRSEARILASAEMSLALPAIPATRDQQTLINGGVLPAAVIGRRPRT